MGLIYCNEIFKESDIFDIWLFGPFHLMNQINMIFQSYISLKHL